MTMTPKQRRATNLLPERVGGWLCLDFANTVEPRGPYKGLGDEPEGERRDFLATYADLVDWGQTAGLLHAGESDALRATAAAHPDTAQAALGRAITVREAIYRVFRTIAEGQMPAGKDVAALTQAHHDAVAQQVLLPVEEGFVWSWRDTQTALDRVLWPVGLNAAALLVEGERARIKMCPGVPGSLAPCNWLFYDTSKNRTRQWCMMADCGTIAKAQRQTVRRRQRRREQR